MEMNIYSDATFRDEYSGNLPDGASIQYKFGNIVVIEETDSFISTEEVFDRISEHCSIDTVKIILTENHNFYNVVQWMRKGATDVLLTSTLTEKGLYNSILSGKSYLHSHIGTVENVEPEPNDDSNNQKLFAAQRVILPKDVNWSQVRDTSSFDMTLVMINFTFDSAKKMFDLSYHNTLLRLVKNELPKICRQFGGMIWFWNGDSGGIAYHFDDHVNLAVASCIHLINSLVLIYSDKLNDYEIPSFRIAIHTGTDNFRINDPEDVNSKIINYTSHLLTRFVPDNTICITDDVYDRLSVRMTDYFSEFSEFEGHSIYKY